MNNILNFEALRSAPVQQKPFPYVIVPHFINAEALEEIEADYPDVEVPGSLPLASLSYGPKFAQFIENIRGPEMQEIIEEKFGINLMGRPTAVTVRGQCRPTDGKIHTDSKTKLITVLLYMNGKWEDPGGRLKLLNSPNDLGDAFAEVPPIQGTLLAFKNQYNAWHGHESFTGKRRAVQLNWVKNQGVVWREQMRHRISAFLKNFF